MGHIFWDGEKRKGRCCGDAKDFKDAVARAGDAVRVGADAVDGAGWAAYVTSWLKSVWCMAPFFRVTNILRRHNLRKRSFFVCTTFLVRQTT